MPDYFDQQSSFTNPSYASPEQLASQRAYADALQKRSGQDVTRPAGAVANVIDALMAGLTRNNANQVQQQAAGQNANDLSEVISQLKNGGPQSVNPETLGRIYANPMASPEHRALATALIGQTPVKSEFGQPAQQSPIGGIVAPTIKGPFTPGYRVEQGAEGVHSNAPVPAPGVTPPGVTRFDPQATQAWRNDNPLPPQAPAPGAPQVSGGPPAPAPAAVPNTPLTLDQLAAKGREYAAQRAFTQGSAEGNTGIARQDIEAASNAPTIKRVAGVMLDDLQRNGDKMTFGPTAAWTNDVKRVAANYAPGFMKDQLEALSSADSFDKMSAQLTSILAKGGGTDAQLFNNMKSVPGSHNSKEGAEALLKMTLQVADQQQALRQFTSQAQSAAQYETMRGDFYKRNPIVNPITGNPIQADIEAARRNTSKATGPEPGAIHNGYRFKGGNPNDKSNWEPST